MSQVAGDENPGTSTTTQADTPSAKRRGPWLVFVLLAVGVSVLILAILVSVTLVAAATG